MKINIIADKESGWILYKFAKKVTDQLLELGIDARLSYQYDSSCDINHYFTPGSVGVNSQNKVDKYCSFMITHVDTQLKIDEIISATKNGAIGICMSSETKNFLISCGVKPNRICYINPAQDGIIKPRKIKLGITHRVYNDCRKRDEILLDVCEKMDPDYFKWVIMGSGWNDIVNKMISMGFEVEYFENFDKEIYDSLMSELDYYCYFGTDEGSMGYLDALAAGIGTIVTPQGYHLDGGCPITYPVNTTEDIIEAINDIKNKVKMKQGKITEWTWESYTLKHLELWKYLLKCESLDSILKNRGKYSDGIYSLILDDLQNFVSISQYLKNRQ